MKQILFSCGSFTNTFCSFVLDLLFCFCLIFVCICLHSIIFSFRKNENGNVELQQSTRVKLDPKKKSPKSNPKFEPKKKSPKRKAACPKNLKEKSGTSPKRKRVDNPKKRKLGKIGYCHWGKDPRTVKLVEEWDKGPRCSSHGGPMTMKDYCKMKGIP